MTEMALTGYTPLIQHRSSLSHTTSRLGCLDHSGALGDFDEDCAAHGARRVALHHRDHPLVLGLVIAWAVETISNRIETPEMRPSWWYDSTTTL